MKPKRTWRRSQKPTEPGAAPQPFKSPFQSYPNSRVLRGRQELPVDGGEDDPSVGIEERFRARLLSVDRYVGAHDERDVFFIYFAPGWNDGNAHTKADSPDDGSPWELPEHMHEIDDLGLLADVLLKTRRCYCNQCLDPDESNTSANIVRKMLADANGIRANGHPENEAKIDKLMEPTNDE